MAVRYQLDTNTASYVIKGNFPRVREHLLKIHMAEVGISSVTEAELRFGWREFQGRSNLPQLLRSFYCDWKSLRGIRIARGNMRSCGLLLNVAGSRWAILT